MIEISPLPKHHERQTRKSIAKVYNVKTTRVIQAILFVFVLHQNVTVQTLLMRNVKLKLLIILWRLAKQQQLHCLVMNILLFSSLYNL